MNPVDLAKKCADAISDSTKYGLPNEDANVMLVLPKGWKAPPRFPRGKTACWQQNSRVAYFNAMNVLAWLAAAGVVTIKGESER